MKRIFLAASIIIAATSFTSSVNANASTITAVSKSGDGQHIPASAVPAPVRDSYHSHFPGGTNAQWQKESEHGGTVYQVDFLNNGKRWRTVFAPDGTLLSSGRR
jgi:hypothetical protein